MFLWYFNECLEGLVALHVDDFLYAGSKLFQDTIVSKITPSFVIGNEENSNFMYLGIQLHCLDNKIELSMKSYTLLLK